MKGADKVRIIGFFLLMQILIPAYGTELLQTRLVGGSGSFEGRVEVYYRGAWGTVCDDSWDLNDAHVVCRTLGYPRASSYHSNAHFGQGTGNIILDNVGCTGSESNLAFCPHNGYLSHNCGHSEDAGVTCDTVAPPQTRLVGGSRPSEGRVELYYQGAWGTVCDDNWDLNDAHVVCRTLGYSRASAYYHSAHFGQGSGDIILNNVGCTGTEFSIAYCPHNGYESHDCSHSEDAGVTCDGIEPLETRLVGGGTSFQGRVEVLHQLAWGTVCDDSFDLNDAHAVCHSLGYPRASAYYHSAHFGRGTGDIILDNLECTGSESNLAFCPHIGYLSHNCGHSEDAAVTCEETEPLQTRLVGNSGLWEGRVEVYYQGAWGTVCDNGWDLNDAHVVCRTLGYPRASAYYHSAHFGRGTGNIMLDEVACTGSETNIAFCQHRGYLTHSCEHSEDAGVTCDRNEPLLTRLVGGSGSWEGRVEVYYQGAWGTICDDGFDLNDAHAVCHSLGYPRASAYYHSAHFGQGTGNIILDDVACTGSEANIAFCRHSGYLSHSCGHSEDAGVACEEPLRTRLVGGSGPWEGRVEVYHQGAWGTVCDDLWGLEDAHVVCHTLGYPRALAYYSNAHFGQGTGEIVLDNLECTGSESNLAFCQHNGYLIENCDHSEDAGVTCNDIVPVRLVGGSSANEGRVEISYRGSWGTICDDSWDINDATVVCRMLGYPNVSSALTHFGPGTGNITLDNVECVGSETHITQCRHDGYEVHNCSHTEDVGIICSGEAELEVRLVGGPDESEGRVELLYMGEWGNVCQYGWTSLDSDVVCRMLGFIGADMNSPRSSYGGGSGNVILRKPECSGKESSLLQCDRAHLDYTYCGHTEALGVSCLEPDDFQVRLVGGESDKEGRVEILSQGTWGTVCDDYWDLTDAHVVCRMLGFERAKNYSCCAAFGQGSGPVVLKEVECDGSETNIGHCHRSNYQANDCGHTEDVSVTCIEYDTDECNRTLDGYPCDAINGQCTNTHGSYICSCSVGYRLDDNNTCHDIDECSQTSGDYPCDAKGGCRNTEGSYVCTCDIGYQLDTNGTFCYDIDECSQTSGNYPCDAKGGCTNTEGSYVCTCDTGYQLHTNGTFCYEMVNRSRRNGLIGGLVLTFIAILVICVILAVWNDRRSTHETGAQSRQQRGDNPQTV